jgi:cytochrome c biogenesis protein CcmG/thiol:disulfide interchange protein DsbE
MSRTAPDETPPAKAKPRAMLVLPLVLVIAILGLMSVALFRPGDPSNLPSMLIGKPVPEFALAAIPTLQDESGAAVPGFSSASLKSGKVSLLNFWASWCAPCVAEHPQLVELGKQGVPIYGVNYKGDKAEAAKRFLTRHGNPFLAVGMDDTGMTGIDMGVTGVPETFVIAGSGRIVLRFQGPLTEEIIAEKIIPAIRKAEKDSAPSGS